jgi:hypothetical protein
METLVADDLIDLVDVASVPMERIEAELVAHAK